jgi:hypothetical protein
LQNWKFGEVFGLFGRRFFSQDENSGNKLGKNV